MYSYVMRLQKSNCEILSDAAWLYSKRRYYVAVCLLCGCKVIPCGCKDPLKLGARLEKVIGDPRVIGSGFTSFGLRLRLWSGAGDLQVCVDIFWAAPRDCRPGLEASNHLCREKKTR